MADKRTMSERVQPNPPYRPGEYARHFVDGWSYEIFSLLLGIILICALCILVYNYEGEPVPSSLGSVFNTNLTLNFIISLILSVALPALIVPVAESMGQLKWIWFRHRRPLDHLESFDEASRGISGSTTFLWKMRARPFASVGAFLTIARLIVGPLAQNAVLYPLEPRSYSDPTDATVHIAESWHDTPMAPDFSLRLSSRNPSFVPLGMMGEIQRGILSVNQVPPLAPSCSTGNCTIGPYRSLGVCSRSADITSSLSNGPDTRTLPGGTSLRLTNYSETAPLLVMDSAADQPAETYWDYLGEPTKPLLFSNSIKFRDSASPIADVFLIHADYSTGDYSATEFVLEWCVQTLNTTMKNGIATTHRLDNYTQFKRKYDIPHVTMTVDTYLSFEQGRDPSDASDIHDYWVSAATHYNYQRHFHSILRGNVTERPTMALSQMIQVATSSEALAFHYFLNIGWYNGSVNGSYTLPPEKPNVILDNIATSMTNGIRQRGPNQFHGLAIRQRPIVRVQWQFLIAPLVFTALCILFFSATLWYQRFADITSSPSLSTFTPSSQRRVRSSAWRSSSLAVAHALEPKLQEKLGAMSSPSVLLKQAEKVEVSLQISLEGDGGWRLTCEEEESKDFDTGKPSNNDRGGDS